ncbi:MAG TPA: hypothetical protein VGS79_20215, partial [Puia sp.]|nr:hypothetical protein [Puia sp.]
LMQGVLPDASAFLVGGLPSRRWFSEAVLRCGAAGDRRAAAAGQPLPPKTRAALKLLERQVGLRLPAEVRIELRSNIPVFYQHAGCRGATIDLPPVTLIYFDAAPEAGIDTVAMPDRWHEGAGRFFSWLLRRLIHAAAEAAELLPRVEALAQSRRTTGVYLEHYNSPYHQTLCTVFPAR